MLTTRKRRLDPPAGVPVVARGAHSGLWRSFVRSIKSLLLLLATASTVSSSRVEPGQAVQEKRRRDRPEQYLAGGARWLESRQGEVVHFICQGGPAYRISLDSASLRRAQVPPGDQPRFLGALRSAVAYWSSLMGCHRFQVELDLPYPNTRIHFVPIRAPGTLATATRAGDIILNVDRSWFPGSERHGNYGPNHQVSFYWVVAHELGHVWGLAHSRRSDSLMYPSQCHTCRWSSFEQAAGNVIRVSSEAPSWSRPHYANRFFAKTPRSVVDRLLSGDLPAETVAMDPAGRCEVRGCTSDPATPDAPGVEGCKEPELAGEAALTGWPLFRLPESMPYPTAPRLCPRSSGTGDVPRAPGHHSRGHRLAPRVWAVLPGCNPGRLWYCLSV